MASTRTASTQIVLRPQQASNLTKRRSSSGGRGRSRRSSLTRQRIANLRKRVSNSSEDTKLAACTIGAPVVAALLEKHAGFTLPTVGGIHPHLLWGGLGALFGKKVFGNGETGRMIRAGGLGLAASAATEVTIAGTPLTAAPAASGASAKKTTKKAATTKTAAKKTAKKKTSVAGDDEVGDDEVGDDEVGDDEVGDDEVGDDEVGDDEVGDDEVGDDEIGDDDY